MADRPNLDELLVDARAWMNEELDALRSQRDRVLVLFYRRDPVAVARLCDEELDRSGALLGRIRSLAGPESVKPLDQAGNA